MVSNDAWERLNGGKVCPSHIDGHWDFWADSLSNLAYRPNV